MSKVLIGVGVVAAAAGAAYFIYNKNKKEQALINSSFAPTPTTSTTPATTPAPVATPAAKQTMWKDKDGNIFQLTSDYGQWGFYIKVNGAIHKKWNMMETMFLGPDGYVYGADNNGSTYVWKNNQWNYVIKDNKTSSGQFLVDHGQPNVYLGIKGFAGLGQTSRLNAFMLN